MKIIYRLSRWYNFIILSIAKFLIKSTCDYTKRNRDIIGNATRAVRFLRDMMGHK